MTAPPSAVFGATAVSPLISPVSSFSRFDASESQVFLNKEQYYRNKFAEEKSFREEINEDDEEENVDENNENSKRIVINKELLIYKAFYFLFYGAVGSLFPYLVVFYKQLYLSAQQVGFLIGIRPFIQMCAVPLWGALADSHNVKKPILLLAIGAWLATNYSLCIVRIPPETACNVTVSMIHFPQVGKLVKPNIKLLRNFTMLPSSVSKLKMNLHKNFDETKKMVNSTDIGMNMKIRSRRSIRLKPRQYPIENSVSQLKTFQETSQSLKAENTMLVEEMPDEVVLLTMTRIKRSHQKLRKFFLIRNHQTATQNNIEKFLSFVYSQLFSETGKSRQPRSLYDIKEHHSTLWGKENHTNYDEKPLQRLLAADEMEEEFDSLNTDDEYPWPIDSIEATKHISDVAENSKNAANIFVVLIIITVVGTLFASPAATLADTATLEKLGDESHQYGYQRLWGAFGWGLCAFVVGAVVSSIQLEECKEGRHVDYILSFYVYAIMMALAFLCAAFFKFKPVETDTDYTDSLWETVKIFSDAQHVLFVLTLLVTGASMGFVHTFLFWHLHDLGGTQFLFSVITAVQCLSEVITYLLSSYLIVKIGCDNVLLIGLLANIIRLFVYAFLTQPIFSIALEILQGISSASIWTAAICYIGLIQGTPVTLQAFLHAIYWGLGHGGGGILGGVLVTYLGSKITFLCYGTVCSINLLLLIGMQYWSKILYVLCNYTYVENIPAGTYILTAMSQQHQASDTMNEDKR